ncbi:MAG: glycosyltransferase family 4 protein [Flaviaesturariibacter sp.]|nr:glycosyltransferase family 4 protein [Flaviaesturariibacter sp.]
MKILSVVWYQVLPARFGGQKGTALFTEYLARTLPLTCLCARSNQPENDLSYKLVPQLPVSKWQFLNPRCWHLIRRTAQAEGATVLMLEFPYHALAAVLIKKRLRIPFILHAHNLESERFRQLGSRWWRLLRIYERWACRHASLVLFKTETDRAAAVSMFGLEPGRTAIVPYGIERKPVISGEGIRKQFAPNGELIILFAGTLDYAPNAAAFISIVKDLAPCLDALSFPYRILVCGRIRSAEFEHLQALTHPYVTLVGEVDDIDPYYAAAAVFIDPVLSGGGVQTKIIDALARDCQVVAFSRAAQGIEADLAPEKVTIVPDGDWTAFADAVLSGSMRRPQTPEAFYKTYSWPAIIHNIAPLINAVVK